MPAMKTKQSQSGVFLIEALIAILIFSLGILGMVAMGGSAIAAQSDAQFRTEAANFAGDIASKITLNVDRTSDLLFNASFDSFAHHPVAGAFCSFAGAASTNALVSGANEWADQLHGVVAGVKGLPGAADSHESIVVDRSLVGPGQYQVTITVCWKPPSTSATPLAPWHRHVLVTYVPPL